MRAASALMPTLGFQESREAQTAEIGDVADHSGGGLIVLFVGGDGFKVFSFKYLVTFQAADIIDPVAPRQNLGTTVIAGLHSRD